MDKQIKDFNELISNASDYLGSQLHYSVRTVVNFKRCWKQVRNIMDSQGIKRFGPEVGKQILLQKFRGVSYTELSTNDKLFFKSIKMLSDFYETGHINILPLPRKEPVTFNGPIGKVITGFLDFKTGKRFSKISFHSYQRNLSRFLSYCDQKGIKLVEDINQVIILQFINELSHRKGNDRTVIKSVITTLRGFFKYAYDQGYLAIDYSNKIPRYKFISQPKIPSTYSKEEIEKLIKSVDRSTPMGKRNYVIILLAARLGLRASDICNLKFENLHWDSSTIRIEQIKTGKEVVLPILPDIGNAIIDYLRYGRIKSEEPYLLLTGRPPCGRFTTSNVVTHIVQRAFRKAGIDINGRRFGPHSLRHSLGFRLLEKNTVLPVISEVLGHENTESTRYYLRIDLKSMKQCMLDVPPVPDNFYLQKGGAFYYG